MRRVIPLLLCLSLILASAACMGEGLETAPGLSGCVCWPEGASPENAQFIYDYDLPQVVSTHPASEGINLFYQSYLSDELAFRVPILAESYAGSKPVRCTVRSRITCSSEDYFCVLMTMEMDFGEDRGCILSSHLFPLTGARSGLAGNLLTYLGILKGGESDTWLENRQTSKVNACVRGLVLEFLRSSGSVPEEDLDPGLLEAGFFPDEDFYLDETGEPVFFIQGGLLTEDPLVPLFIPLTRSRILDEL